MREDILTIIKSAKDVTNVVILTHAGRAPAYKRKSLGSQK